MGNRYVRRIMDGEALVRADLVEKQFGFSRCG
jgi:hypothetical protein